MATTDNPSPNKKWSVGYEKHGHSIPYKNQVLDIFGKPEESVFLDTKMQMLH